MNFKEFVKKYNLFAIVFLTGAAVLIVEVTAVRILSIYFGNTIYTVSGVIGVILAALAVGYAKGGVLADKKPTRYDFFRVIQKAGIALIVLSLLMNTVLAYLGNFLPLSWGPIFVSLILFFAPSYFLGMLSPFAVKLGQNENPGIGVGTVSGKVFFWSTCGSIVGTFLAAFVLIPSFGLNAIVFGTTLCIILMGGIGKVIAGKESDRDLNIFILAVLIIVLFLIFYFGMHPPPGVLFGKDGAYQHLAVLDGTFAGRPARFLYQDRSMNDPIFLDGNDLTDAYTRYYALYKIFKPNLTRALFIGGATYVMPTALNRELPNAKIDVAEIEPSLFELAQKYFNVPNDKNLVNHVEDGRHFLNKITDPYDMIVSDVYYSLYSIPPAYTTAEYFNEARKKLAPGGIFMANLVGAFAPDKSSFLLSEIKTIQKEFPETFVFAVSSTDSVDLQNIIVVGVNSPSGSTTFSFPSSIPAPLPSDLLSHLVPLSKYDLLGHIVFTDDYSPVENMTAEMLSATEFFKTPNGALWSGGTVPLVANSF